MRLACSIFQVFKVLGFVSVVLLYLALLGDLYVKSRLIMEVGWLSMDGVCSCLVYLILS